jgi:PqqD family protein of HPr-rel-A system
MTPSLAPERSGSPAPHWRVSSGQQLQHHSWDADEIVLFNDLAGDTHLLDQDALDVLHLLRDCPGDTAALAARLQLDAEQADALAALLETLRNLSLVEYQA